MGEPSNSQTQTALTSKLFMPKSPRFLFVCCQVGAEQACKQELTTRYPGLRFAFSRPGFMTFKVVDPKIKVKTFRLWSTFARLWGWSAGKAINDDADLLATDMAEQMSALCKKTPLTSLHFWQRDTSQPGKGGFEPGISPVAHQASKLLVEKLKPQFPDMRCNKVSKTDERTICVILVAPNEWWLGWHDASSIAQTWPGGAPPIQLPGSAVNRAWLKINEAVLWSELPIHKTDVVAEIGSAPGGASQYLLSLGAKVIAIDPAAMDPVVLKDRGLKHIRRKARDVPKKDLENVRWLTIDINMPPSYTIEVIRDYVLERGLPVRGIIATLKLPDWKLATEVQTYRKQLEDLGFGTVQTRQLAFNRQEICLVAVRKRKLPTRVPIGKKPSSKRQPKS